MRVATAVLVVIVGVPGVMAQAPADIQPPKRYGIEPNLDTYPQATPKDTLTSVLSAIERKRVGYLLAHLADPGFVDTRVKELGGFDELVKETTDKLAADPTTVKDLGRFLREGEWDVKDDSASARLKDVKDHVYFRKIGGRWFLENRKSES